MILYTVLHHDRHCDPFVYVYSTREKAIKTAREICDEYRNVEIRTIDGWLFHASLNEESYVTVRETEMDRY